MVIFHSYVGLPEGNPWVQNFIWVKTLAQSAESTQGPNEVGHGGAQKRNLIAGHDRKPTRHCNTIF